MPAVLKGSCLPMFTSYIQIPMVKSNVHVQSEPIQIVC